MKKETLKVIADVNGINYQSEVDNYIKREEEEQIASCKRQIVEMLDIDGLVDFHSDYIVEKIMTKSTR